MSVADIVTMDELIDGIPTRVRMPTTPGRAYTLLVALGYEQMHAAAVAVGRQPCPPDFAARYARRAARAQPRAA